MEEGEDKVEEVGEQMEVEKDDTRTNLAEEDGKEEIVEEAEMGEEEDEPVEEPETVFEEPEKVEEEDGLWAEETSNEMPMSSEKLFAKQKNIFDNIDDLNTLDTLDDLLVGSSPNI